jgi:hypothetical protein
MPKWLSRGNYGRRHLIMQLGRALLGAIIGAAVSIGLLVAVYIAFDLDKTWLALPVAILTGLGVRMMVSTSGHASYLRGALTGAIALGAYLLGWYVVAQVAQANASKAAEPRITQQAAADQPEDTDDADAAKDEEPETPKAPAERTVRPAAATGQKAQMPKSFEPLDFVFLCVSALIAYELGRGTAAKPVVVAEETITEVPIAKHPDA